MVFDQISILIGIKEVRLLYKHDFLWKQIPSIPPAWHFNIKTNSVYYLSLVSQTFFVHYYDILWDSRWL